MNNKNKMIYTALAVMISALLTACGGGGGGGDSGGGSESGLDMTEHLRTVKLDQVFATGAKGAGVTIGISDDGINADWPEFGGRVLYREELMLDGHPYDPSVDSHGTPVAALAIGGTFGAAPEAWAIDYRTGGRTDIPEATAGDGGMIVNSSYYPAGANSSAMPEIRSSGSVLVTGAGNSNEDNSLDGANIHSNPDFTYLPFDPVLGSRVLIAGGYDPMYEEAPWSMSGIAGGDPRVQARFLLAPSCSWSINAASGDPTIFCGTSASAPIVTGTLATLSARFPAASLEELMQVVLDTADRSFAAAAYADTSCGGQSCGLVLYGQGLLDAKAAYDELARRYPG